MKKMNNKGFSLVELIVVIAIMAVLVGVLAPQFIKYVEKARESTDIQTCDNLVSALKNYLADKENVDPNYTITVGTGGLTSPAASACVAGATDKAAAAIYDAGLANAKLKGTKWDSNEITITYDTSTGAVEYTANSTYYEPSTDNSYLVAK